MEGKNYFDAHCHIFNLGYAIQEAKCMILRKCRLNNNVGFQDKGFFSFAGNITDFLKWFYEFISEATGSEESNFNTLRSTAKKAWNLSVEPYIIPLMMDIQYIFDAPMDGSKDSSINDDLDSSDIDVNYAFETFDKATSDFLEYIANKTLNTKDNGSDKIEFLKKIVEDEKNSISSLALQEKGSDQFCMTSGYKNHFDALVALKKKYPTELFPFLAIDPRRPGAIDAVLKGDLVGKDKIFAGVKIYPRLGYTPDCPELMRLYAYCESNDIPITAHCSQGGFPLTKWPHHEYCNPERYKPALSAFPKLRIDFAHFGYRYAIYDKEYTKLWADTILELMNNYPNVYTDISCYTAVADLNTVANNYWNKGGVIQNRLMFGSDFDVMNLTEIGMTLEEYYKQFTTIFGNAAIDIMSVENPKNFLNLDAMKSSGANRKGHCIAIGLNEVDATHYGGWNGKLSCCENDVKAFKEILKPLNYSCETLLTKLATRKNVVEKITNAANGLDDGDILLVYYSGHGGQVKDLNDDGEVDDQDETWCLYDGQLLDDELYKIWLGVTKKIRILLISDSCHSGTILKALESAAESSITKIMPFDVSDTVYRENQEFYKAIFKEKTGVRLDFENNIVPTILLISACQDNQTASAGYMNSLFTSRLILIWNNGHFTGDYRTFHGKILQACPPTQSPNYVVLGSRNQEFESEKPFTI